MPSFDIVSTVDKQEVTNAVVQTNKEVGTRFDFKGSDSRVEQSEYALVLFADDEFKLKQVFDILNAKLAKRGIDVRCLEKGKIETISGNKVKQTIQIKVGIDSDLAKKMVKVVKDSKLKVQASVQGDAVRVSGAKKDLLQEAIRLVKAQNYSLPLQFQNFRD
ncbi:MAG: YajQ family cyclic di-GMP-binding protein [Burkholderiales bacterium]